MLKETRRLLRRSGSADPCNIQEYLEDGGYGAFEKLLGTPPSAILEMIAASGLRGRGGAGFPTGTKAQAASSSQAPCIRFVVCNADEGEPGTFKDRVLMESDPHSVVEGMLIAALAVGAERGYFYIRGEYYQSIEHINTALKAAREAGLLGKNILGSDFSFDAEVLSGAGSYLCGEELTLLESLEGKRGYPRIKPPFPAEKGLWDQPTLVNNVETLANLPLIVSEGPEAFRSLGTERSPGTKLVCVSGDVRKPGVYEVAMGCSVHDVIHDLAGGPKANDSIAFVLLGGAAGTFASADQLKLPLCFDALRQAGLTLGSGAIMVFGQQSSLTRIMASVLHFFKHESCGKCVPCRTGTAHLAAAWDLASALSAEEKKKVLTTLSQDAALIAASCLCPLGQSPVMPLASALKHIPEHLER
jgi:NADH-quinone oxidoreductase subunit F